MDKPVLVDVRDRVATITLNKPAASNALDLEIARELLSAALRCEDDPGVRAVVVTGAGKHLCFGGDLRGMSEQGERVTAYLNELTTHLHAAISSFTRMRAPVIAAVNGTAAGAGIGLVCMTDLAICGKGSKFSLAYTGVGLVPDGSTSFLLPRIVGRRRALELFLLNRVLTAEEALAWGLVNQVVPVAELDHAVDTLLGQILRFSPRVIGLGKRAFYDQIERAEPDAYEHVRPVMAANAADPDAQEGIAAFLEKRPPEWPGR